MRTRLIREGFYMNVALGRCHPCARQMFSGLWGLADRCGRLEDRPDQIARHTIPFDRVDPDEMLWQLAAAGMIARYVDAAGLPLIAVLTFARHQRPHPSEPASRFAPLEAPGVVVLSHSMRANDRAGKRGEALNHSEWERSSEFECEGESSVPAALNANAPTSQLTIEGIPPLAAVESAMRKKARSARYAPPACPVAQVLDLWRQVFPNLAPPLEPFVGAPARHLRARWRENAIHRRWADQAEGLAWLAAHAFAFISTSRFLMGFTGPRVGSHQAFELTLDWLVEPANWRRVLQGLYHDPQSRRHGA